VNITVVVPTIRRECIRKWLDEWADDLGDARVIIVEDNPTRSFDIKGVEHYAHEDINSDLREHAWIIPRKTSAVRSYGFLKALEGPCDAIWTLDDDCYPEEGHKDQYMRLLEENFKQPVVANDVHNGWWNTIPEQDYPTYPRGYPYEIRDKDRMVAVHHGLWSNIPDLDGITQMSNPDFRLPPAVEIDVVPENALFPMCIMNVAFLREMTGCMYQMLMGVDKDGDRWGFDRFEDIWCGLFMKRIADHLELAVTSGSPGVHHSRASDAQKNAKLEAAGIVAHEEFWKYVSRVHLTGDSVAACYHEFGDAVKSTPVAPPKCRTNYWTHLGNAMTTWSNLVKERA
jgi:Reversibly glycosylated polypeptide